MNQEHTQHQTFEKRILITEDEKMKKGEVITSRKGIAHVSRRILQQTV